jgi:hypothetical protein
MSRRIAKMMRHVLEPKISNYAVDHDPRADLCWILRGLGPESPAKTGDFASRPESPATGAGVSGWTQEPEPRRPHRTNREEKPQ